MDKVFKPQTNEILIQKKKSNEFQISVRHLLGTISQKIENPVQKAMLLNATKIYSPFQTYLFQDRKYLKNQSTDQPTIETYFDALYLTDLG